MSNSINHLDYIFVYMYYVPMENEIKTEIKCAMIRSGFTVRAVAKELGLSGESLSNMLSRGSIRYSVAKKIADIIGYNLEFTPKK